MTDVDSVHENSVAGHERDSNKQRVRIGASLPERAINELISLCFIVFIPIASPYNRGLCVKENSIVFCGVFIDMLSRSALHIGKMVREIVTPSSCASIVISEPPQLVNQYHAGSESFATMALAHKIAALST
jgi:hypothetical protein